MQFNKTYVQGWTVCRERTGVRSDDVHGRLQEVIGTTPGKEEVELRREQQPRVESGTVTEKLDGRDIRSNYFLLFTLESALLCVDSSANFS